MSAQGIKFFQYLSHMLNTALSRKARRESVVHNVTANNLSILEHVQQLRSHIMRSLIWLIIFSFTTLLFMQPILTYLKQPYELFLNTGGKNSISQNLIATSIFEVMTINFKICFFIGFALSLPFILYELWKFVSPALYTSEKKIAGCVLIASVFLFYSGVLFGYFLIIPYFFNSALTWASHYSNVMITYESYFGTLTTMLLIFAIVFEVPVVLSLLGLAGLLPSRVLAKNRKIAFLACFIIGAILAPPDVFALCLVAIPMYFMVEISIYSLKQIEKWKINKDPADSAKASPRDDI